MKNRPSLYGSWLVVITCLVFATGQLNYAQGQSVQKPVVTRDLAGLVAQKGLATIDLELYTGSLLMQSLSELSTVQADDKLLKQTLELFARYKSKQIKGRGTLISYEAGGNGAAYLLYLNKSETLREQVAEYAEKMVKNQKRSTDNLMTAPWLPDSLDPVFIDVAFAVTPYLLYSGLALNKPDYIDYAVYQTTGLFRVLADPNGLLHQGRGFRAKGTVSQDNWSRGNGWGALALAALVRDLPAKHPQRKAVETLAKRFFTAVLKHQDRAGLWHQEMTDTSSYVETSGSGLLLYAMGVSLEKGVLDKATYLPAFRRGITELTAYVGDDGAVTHACGSCLYPGQGTKADYIKKEWHYNDPHAFGPVVLAFTQAHKLGITSVTPTQLPGHVIDREAALRTPQTYLRYMPEANGNILWENDRIAFRVYGPPVKDRVSSGIDVWTKSVAYPIIDRWYRLNAQGKEYHDDRGEGCDFFHVGFGRGNGGTAIWMNDKPYISQPYATHKILKNTDKEIAFELIFDPWNVGDSPTQFKVTERKMISMKMGTNLFKVVSTFETDHKGPLTVGIGISYAAKPEILTDQTKGTLTVWESYQPKNGELGTSVLANPADVQGFTAHEKEQFMLVRVMPGQPITYYVGAGWSKNPHVKTKQQWLTYLESELPKLTF